MIQERGSRAALEFDCG